MGKNATINNEPKIDALTATKVLADVFDEIDAQPNTIPVEALAGYQDFKRKRFIPQQILLIFIIVLWLLVPLFFIPPKYEIQQVSMNDQNLPVYTVKVDSFLPVRQVEAALNGEPIQVYAKDSKTYAVEPSQNGRMEIKATGINRQITTRSVDVTEVDDMGPKLISSEIDNEHIYLQMAENGTGVAYENIYAVGQKTGEIVTPEQYDKENGTIIFLIPEKGKCVVYIPDKRGNALHLSIEME